MRFVRAVVYGLSSLLCFSLGKYGMHDVPVLAILPGLVGLALGIAAAYQLLEAVSWGIITFLKSLQKRQNKSRDGYARRTRPTPYTGVVAAVQVPVVTTTHDEETIVPEPEQIPLVRRR